MQMIDRKIQPSIVDICETNFENPQRITLSNGIDVFMFDAGTQDVMRIEVLFKAGTKYNRNKRLPSMVNKLLVEGTKSKTGKTIASAIDYFGASLTSKVTNDFAFVNLTVLNKYLDDTLPFLVDVIANANFPQEEIDLYLNKKAQELSISNQRVDFVARDRFPALIYGEESAYGRPTYIEDYQKVTRENLLDFHQKYYNQNQFEIHISGKVPTDIESKLEAHFSSFAQSFKVEVIQQQFKAASERNHKIEFPQAVQNAIRIGCPWVGRNHKDYVKLQVLTTLFGGYFGSRLMMNIREDKGYTYGIGAGVSHNQEASFIFITSEVKAEVTQDALKEIYAEMQKLQNEEVPEEELNLVKSVMQGSFQRGFDGPFAKADRFKEIRMADLAMDFYTKFVAELKSTTPNELKQLAKQYFNVNDFYELIVGKNQ